MFFENLKLLGYSLCQLKKTTEQYFYMNKLLPGMSE